MAREVHVSREVVIPEGVSVEVEGLRVKVKGPKGEILKDFSHARGVNIRVEGNR
ncbi:MAG: 50S ribosomal protein L6, partial [Acidilobaceae archaeon]